MEIYYDNGGFFSQKSAFTKQKTDQITNETSSGYGGSFGYTQIQELPKYYGNVELGGRFLDEKITLGMNANLADRPIVFVEICDIAPSLRWRNLAKYSSLKRWEFVFV